MPDSRKHKIRRPPPARKSLSREQMTQLSRLMADFAHALRNSLSVLRGEIELCLLNPRSIEEYQQVLKSNLEEVEQLCRLVDSVFILVRAGVGELKMNFQEVRLKELLTRLVSRCRETAAQKGLDLTIIAKNEIVIKGDQQRLQQLFDCLLENALDYAERGTKLEVSVEERGKMARVLVQDQGPGIPSEELPRVFEPFFRGKAGANREKGFGLGLSLCKLIAQAHNGSLELKSKTGENKGTRVEVKLPIKGRANPEHQ